MADSVSVRFFVDNEIQNVDSSFYVEFLALDSLFVVHPEKSKIKIPDFAEREFVQLSFVCDDSIIVIPEVSIDDQLDCSE